MRVHVAEWRRPGGDDMDLVQKREMILEQERNFAAAKGVPTFAHGSGRTNILLNRMGGQHASR